MIGLLLPPLLASASAAAEAAPTPPLPPRESSATGSFGYRFVDLSVKTDDQATRISGLLCRRAFYASISPSRVQIERVDASGAPLETKYAYVAAISRRVDQPCSHYSLKLTPPLTNGQSLVICLPHKQGCKRAS